MSENNCYLSVWNSLNSLNVVIFNCTKILQMTAWLLFMTKKLSLSLSLSTPLSLSHTQKHRIFYLCIFLFVGFLGWFHSLAIINTATINTDEKLALWFCNKKTLKSISWNDAVRLYDTFMFNFLLLRGLHSDFYGIWNSLHFQLLCIKILPCSHPCQYL